MTETSTINPIATLNDTFRTTLQGGTVVLTEGIQAYSPDEREIIIAEVQGFHSFPAGDDPYGEHDFGAFQFNGQKILWKIDYYDLKMEYLSENPADPVKTKRVLTILLANEY